MITLVLLAILSAALHIRAEYRGPRQQVYLFKPLTMVWIALIALQAKAAPAFYRYTILAGLLFSMAGDVFLMLPSDRFVAGLAAFLVAQLCYSAAFLSELRTLLWWPLAPLAAYGVAIYLLLARSLGRLRTPVLVYIVGILAMAWFASERWVQSGQGSALLAFLGAILFVLSDTVLALDRFRGRFRLAHALNLSTYFAAQGLIAASVGF